MKWKGIWEGVRGKAKSNIAHGDELDTDRQAVK